MSLVCPNRLAQQSQAFIALLKADAFFEAHEALELLWFPIRHHETAEVRLLRAYINAAVSFELIKRGRAQSSLKPWGFFLRHKRLIKEVPKTHHMHYQKLHDAILNIHHKL